MTRYQTILFLLVFPCLTSHPNFPLLHHTKVKLHELNLNTFPLICTHAHDGSDNTDGNDNYYGNDDTNTTNRLLTNMAITITHKVIHIKLSLTHVVHVV